MMKQKHESPTQETQEIDGPVTPKRINSPQRDPLDLQLKNQ